MKINLLSFTSWKFQTNIIKSIFASKTTRSSAPATGVAAAGVATASASASFPSGSFNPLNIPHYAL